MFKYERVITFSELETIREEEVAGYLKILSQHSPRGTGDINGRFSLDNWCHG
jgi:hypothetical protein